MDPQRDPKRGKKRMMQEIDGVRFECRDVVNLTWLRPYGKVFYVFDQQNSGNLCFGVDGPYGKLFVKYAGSRTMNYTGKPQDAVMQLQNAVLLYEKIHHPALLPLLTHGAVLGGQGYAAIFQWIDAPCLRPTPPDPAILTRLHHLPLPSRLRMLDDIFDLHARLAEEGYVAVDFDDSNLLIDFDQGRITVCDIDAYQRRPLYNLKGRMPGSSLFRAPEEFEKDASIDESTMVYEMGCLTFLFLGDPDERTQDTWTASRWLYRVAHTAVQPQKIDRYPSMRTFLHAWRSAVKDSWVR